jgi:hypothetical protein
LDNRHTAVFLEQSNHAAIHRIQGGIGSRHFSSHIRRTGVPSIYEIPLKNIESAIFRFNSIGFRFFSQYFY